MSNQQDPASSNGTPLAPVGSEASTILPAADRLSPQERMVADVEEYLARTALSYQLGQDEYYLRAALAGALESYREGNYAVGAVVIVVEPDRIIQVDSRNAMITGVGITEHAETRGLQELAEFMKFVSTGERSGDVLELPRVEYPRDTNEHTSNMREGIHVFTTLEPCPMCTCTVINSGAISCKIAALDTFAGSALGERWDRFPPVWKSIAEKRGLKFSLYESDRDLRIGELSLGIFLQTREAIDLELARRK